LVTLRTGIVVSCSKHKWCSIYNFELWRHQHRPGDYLTYGIVFDSDSLVVINIKHGCHKHKDKETYPYIHILYISHLLCTVHTILILDSLLLYYHVFHLPFGNTWDPLCRYSSMYMFYLWWQGCQGRNTVCTVLYVKHMVLQYNALCLLCWCCMSRYNIHWIC
jgi:hypothetical protein